MKLEELGIDILQRIAGSLDLRELYALQQSKRVFLRVLCDASLWVRCLEGTDGLASCAWGPRAPRILQRLCPGVEKFRGTSSGPTHPAAALPYLRQCRGGRQRVELPEVGIETNILTTLTAVSVAQVGCGS